ncbi:hypothetical protein [Stenotrophomonas sp.]|uniref:hypothetical protein n=1 Tax=Stenotrophomonas sp. TaxID=69392 RepID=UPI003D139851
MFPAICSPSLQGLLPAGYSPSWYEFQFESDLIDTVNPTTTAIIMLPMAQALCCWTDWQDHLPIAGKLETAVAAGIKAACREQYRPVINCSYLTQSPVNCVNSA